ncbi:hypothetical protein FB451DRAFT_1285479 [Mycena latifolia]|nr:hypothetical protein FB451DRAFT_1285479 [Mycena latifolia]
MISGAGVMGSLYLYVVLCSRLMASLPMNGKKMWQALFHRQINTTWPNNDGARRVLEGQALRSDEKVVAVKLGWCAGLTSSTTAELGSRNTAVVVYPAWGAAIIKFTLFHYGINYLSHLHNCAEVPSVKVQSFHGPCMSFQKSAFLAKK